MEKLCYTTADIKEMLGCGICKAQQYMREIKAYGDRLKITGKIAKIDFDNWFYSRENNLKNKEEK